MSNRSIGEETFREKPDISQVFIRAIDRCNHIAALGEFGISESAVSAILSTLPIASREWVYSESDRFRSEPFTLVYKTFSGVRMGDPIPLRNDESIPFTYFEGEIDWTDSNIIGAVNQDGYEHAVLHDSSIPVKRLRGELDYDDPNIISPKLKQIPSLDLQKFKETVMEAAQYAGLTWQSELTLVDGGDTLEEITRRKTPHRIPDHLRKELKEDESPRTSS